jgi:DNA-binding HxlR family transcriptional regulator
MRGYGQFCPVAKAAEVIGERWTPLVLRELVCGSRRFNDIRRGVPLMSPTLLSQRLKTLERAGIVVRRKGAGGVEYQLTPAGEELRPVIEMMGVWGVRWAQRQVTRDDLDPAILMWDMRRRIALDALPAGRTVIQFTFTDVPKPKRDWWLVGDRDGLELCLKDPGFDVDLYVTSDIATMARVWLGEPRLDAAIASGRVDLQGPRDIQRRFRHGLQLSVFAAAPRPPRGLDR